MPRESIASLRGLSGYEAITGAVCSWESPFRILSYGANLLHLWQAAARLLMGGVTVCDSHSVWY